MAGTIAPPPGTMGLRTGWPGILKRGMAIRSSPIPNAHAIFVPPPPEGEESEENLETSRGKKLTPWKWLLRFVRRSSSRAG